MAHHHHQPATPESRRGLVITLILVCAYMLAEVIGGLLSNSLALLADAGHMLSDAAALGLALFAIWMSRRPATSTRTWGFYRAEILAALVNGSALLVISTLIFIEAWQRFSEPPEVESGLMIAVASGGLAVNLIGLSVLSKHRDHSLNVRGAWLHVLTDALGSLQAIIAGVLIYRFGWLWLDPVASILIAALVAFSAWSLLRDSVAVLMEGTPAHIDVDEVRDVLLDHSQVVGVHDLHIWTITSGMESLSAHLVVDPAADDDLLPSLQKMLGKRFGIDHVTLQLELDDCAVKHLSY